jgi:hypothetical protein
MRILFYLPVVTPWWFHHTIVPMMRALHDGPATVELHVMVAPLWRNTGLEAQHLLAAADLEAVHWHVIDEGEPDQFRLAGAEVPGLLDLVTAIAPDLTLARSADFAISRQFPGTVRFITEASAPPYAQNRHLIVIEEQPFAPAVVPAHAIARADVYAECLQRVLPDIEQCPPLDRPAALRRTLGLPHDRPVIAVPLQYEHEENYFLHHAAFPDSLALLERLLAELPDDVVLAVADHPLNRQHVDRNAVSAFVTQNPDRMVNCSATRATDMLAICADVMLTDLSKCWMLSAFFGTPLVNIGLQPVADWLNALPTLDALPAALAVQRFARPDPVAARRWFGWHLGARVLDPKAITLDRLIRSVEEQPSDADVAQNLAMAVDDQRARFAKLKHAA